MRAPLNIHRYAVTDTPYKTQDYVIYEASHPDHEVPVFLKTANPQTRDRQGVTHGLTQEAALLRSCRHRSC